MLAGSAVRLSRSVPNTANVRCPYTDALFITAHLLCTCKQICEMFRVHIGRFSIGLDSLGLM